MDTFIMPVCNQVCMDAWTYLGFAAGALTSTGYLPQIIKGYRTGRLQDVSLLMPMILCVGMTMWLVYGLAKDDLAIIVANIVGVSFTALLVAMKVLYGKRAHGSMQ